MLEALADASVPALRDYARNSNQRLTDVSRQFVDSATADFPPAAIPPAARTGMSPPCRPGNRLEWLICPSSAAPMR
ncbi:MAG: hypothetical protein ACR2MP_24320 [Streptosporangiaceae bacterium]